MVVVSQVTLSGKIQESTKVNYTDIKLYSMCQIDNKDSELITMKKVPTIKCAMQCLQWMPRFGFNMAVSPKRRMHHHCLISFYDGVQPVPCLTAGVICPGITQFN